MQRKRERDNNSYNVISNLSSCFRLYVNPFIAIRIPIKYIDMSACLWLWQIFKLMCWNWNSYNSMRSPKTEPNMASFFILKMRTDNILNSDLNKIRKFYHLQRSVVFWMSKWLISTTLWINFICFSVWIISKFRFIYSLLFYFYWLPWNFITAILSTWNRSISNRKRVNRLFKIKRWGSNYSIIFFIKVPLIYFAIFKSVM